MTGVAEWIIGGALVVLYAQGRFHTPRTIVGSTTLFRYYLAASFYYAACLLLFCFLTVLVKGSPDVLAALGGKADAIPESLRGVSSPILAALLMTSLLPNFPVLSKLDAWMLHLFQDLGHIPLEVRWWRDRLAASGVTIPASVVPGLRRKLEEARFAAVREEDLRFAADDSPQYRFTELIYLMSVIEDFSTARGKYPRVLDRFQDEYLDIRQRFEQVIARAARYFSVASGQDESAAATPAVIELKRSFREQCDGTLKEACQLLARGILMNELTQEDRSRALKALGFPSFEEVGTPLDINQVLAVSCVVGLILFAGLSFIAGPGDSSRALFVAVMVAVIYGAAVVCALAPKSAWRFANVSEKGIRPVWAYLVSGVLAVACAITVSVMFKSLMLEGGLMAAVRDIRFSYPWYLLSFCVAVSLAAFADDWSGRAGREPAWGRYAEGLALAVLLAGTTLLAGEMFREIPNLPADRFIPDVRAMALMAVIGFFLGVTMPSLYRRMRAAAPEDEARQVPLAESRGAAVLDR